MLIILPTMQVLMTILLVVLPYGTAILCVIPRFLQFDAALVTYPAFIITLLAVGTALYLGRFDTYCL